VGEPSAKTRHGRLGLTAVPSVVATLRLPLLMPTIGSIDRTQSGRGLTALETSYGLVSDGLGIICPLIPETRNFKEM
jgi:hypothetical protein